MSEAVDIEIVDGVATVTVSNPPVNALSDAVLEELGVAAERLESRQGVRAVVLTAAGERTFIAGADLEEFAAALGDAGAMEAHVALTGRVFGAWAALSPPIVAAVDGHATGGGLELALLCDLIVADGRARLGVPEVTLGLIPGAGATQRLPRRVSRSRATRMLLLGELLTAPEALDAGLVDYVAGAGEALTTAQDLAARLAALPARAVTAAKTALRDSGPATFSEGLMLERRLFLAVAASGDAREGVTSFLTKRAPSFSHS